MAKVPQHKSPDSETTPGYVVLSLVLALMIYSLEGIKVTLGWEPNSGEPNIILGFIGLGLCLAFFWRRLRPSPFKRMSAPLYTFGLWIYLFAAILGAPLSNFFLEGLTVHLALLAYGIVGSVSLIVTAAWLYESRMTPPLLLSAFAGAIASMGTVLSGIQNIYPNEPILRAVTAHIEHHQQTHQNPLKFLFGKDDERREEKIPPQADENEVFEPARPVPARHMTAALGSAEPSHENSVRPHEDQPMMASSTGEKTKPMEHVQVLKHETDTHSQVATPESGHDESSQGKTTEVRKKEQNSVIQLSAKTKPNVHPSEEKETHSDHKIDSEVAAPSSDKRVHLATADIKKISSIWSYNGKTGPQFWSQLSDRYAICETGEEQSPIDIPRDWPISTDIKISYRPSFFHVIRDGQSLHFSVESGNFVTLAGKKYELKEISLHHPSEHQLDGVTFPMEAEFFHHSNDGQILVLSSLIRVGDTNSTYSRLLDYLPQTNERDAFSKGVMFHPRDILPEEVDVYRYQGSLTNPPCTEHISWNVIRETITLSEDQIARFKAILRSNARPIQPRNLR